ncbi:MAG: lipopolysaccharide biosynthesis protein [Pirellulales bacterium]|nr:lipopolysaccharide biosynthesis protein [Pirellulales bacterium]
MNATGPLLETEIAPDEVAVESMRTDSVARLSPPPAAFVAVDAPPVSGGAETERLHDAAEPGACDVCLPRANRSRATADTLANSLLVLCLLSLVQPVLGLARGVLFCRWLAPDQLGRWDLSLGLLTFATPLLLLGIPGSFGRYVGHYLQHGGLGRFVRQAVLICLTVVSLASVLLFVEAGAFADLYYGDATRISLARAVALALVPLAGYGFVVELLTALRLFRVSSLVQLARTTAFLVFGMVLVWGWRPSATSVVLAFAMASVASIMLGLWWLVAVWREAPRVPIDGPVVVWRRVLPFALGVWCCNLVTNAFDMVNPYMLAHCGRLPHEEAMAEVGNLHSARILPLLIFAFSSTLASMLLPHLTHSWEQGRRDEVGRDVRLFAKLYAVALAAGSVGVLILAPFLFGVVFRGKYDGGLHVLPWTLMSASWMGVAFIAQAYLWCREEARLSSFALAIGLAMNLLCNALLVPQWGLQGTVTASATGMLTVLAAALLFGQRFGLRVDRTLWAAVSLPALVLLGTWPAAIALVALIIASSTTSLVFDAAERHRIADLIRATVRHVPMVPVR